MKPILWKWSEETIGLQAQMCRWLISGSNPLVPTKSFIMEKVIKLLGSSNKDDIILGMSVLKNFSLLKIRYIINTQYLINTKPFTSIYNQFPEYKVTNYCTFEERSKNIDALILMTFEKEKFYVFYDSHVLGICYPESKYITNPHSEVIKI